MDTEKIWRESLEKHPQKEKLNQIINKILKNAKGNIDLYYIELSEHQEPF